MEISFSNLPFIPERGQVIYVESEYNEKINSYIQKNYEHLKCFFAMQGLMFCYLPLLAKETIMYNAPYVTKNVLNETLNNVPSLAQYAVGVDTIEPSLVFAIKLPMMDEQGNTILQCVPIKTKWFMTMGMTFRSLISRIVAIEKTLCQRYANDTRVYRAEEWLKAKRAEEKRRIAEAERQCNIVKPNKSYDDAECASYDYGSEKDRKKYWNEAVRKLMAEEDNAKVAEDAAPYQTTPAQAKQDREGVRYSIPSGPPGGFPGNKHLDAYEAFLEKQRREREEIEHQWEQIERKFGVESLQLVKEIMQKAELLRNKGVNTMFLHQLIDINQKESRLKITEDFKIFLIDYNNIEIKLTPLYKSLFFLFLRHPEGIVFKELSDYTNELLAIYRKLSPSRDYTLLIESVHRIANPLDNSINEKCARIREAFVSQISETLAEPYCIKGRSGERKRIHLNRSMIIDEGNIL